GDAAERAAFDGERKRRQQAADGGNIVVAESARASRRPGRIEAIHLADRAFAGKAVDDGEIVRRALFGVVADGVEVGGLAGMQAAAQFALAVLDQEKERRAAPAFFPFVTLIGPAVFGEGLL